MSIASMKLKLNLGTVGERLADVELEVVAVHHHPDNREMSVHLRPAGRPELGTVDLVLLGEDMEAALERGISEGARFVLTLA